MKTLIFILTSIIVLLGLAGCDQLGNQENPLSGIVYNTIEEIPEFHGYESGGGAVIMGEKKPNEESRFAIQLIYKYKHAVCIFEELIYYGNGEDLKYKILDTINLGYIGPQKSISFMYNTCLQNEVANGEILALVYLDGYKEFYEKIIRAWKADTKTGKIVPISINGIKCYNEGFESYLDDDYDLGESEEPEANEKRDTILGEEITETEMDTLEEKN